METVESYICQNWEIYIPLIIAALSFLVKVIFDARESSFRIDQLKENKIQDRRSEIIKKLNEFYGPFQQNMNKSTSLYRSIIMDKPKEFRTLKYLLAGESEFPDLKLTNNDRTILREIIDIGKEQQKLILEKAGLIDDPVLSYSFEHESDSEFEEYREDLRSLGLLGWANAHYRILELAYNEELKGDLEKFKHYVFPRELKSNITRRIKELSSELDELRRLSSRKDKEFKKVLK